MLPMAIRLDHLPSYLLLEGVGAMWGGGEFGRGCATGRMPGAVQGVTPVFIPQAIEEGRTLLDLAASA